MTLIVRAGAVLAALGTVVGIIAYAEDKWDGYIKNVQVTAYADGILAEVKKSAKKGTDAYEAGLKKGRQEISDRTIISQRLEEIRVELQQARDAEQIARAELSTLKKQNSRKLSMQRTRFISEQMEMDHQLNETKKEKYAAISKLEHHLEQWKQERDGFVRDNEAIRKSIKKHENARTAIQAENVELLNKISRLNNQLIQKKSPGNNSTAKKPDSKSMCVRSGQSILVDVGNFVDQCKSKAIIVVRRVYNAGPYPHTNIIINGSEIQLSLGKRAKLSTNCFVTLLKITKNKSNRWAPVLRFKCS